MSETKQIAQEMSRWGMDGAPVEKICLMMLISRRQGAEDSRKKECGRQTQRKTGPMRKER